MFAPACEEDEITKEEQVKEDKELLENLSDYVISDANEMKESKGLQALMAMMETMQISDPFYDDPYASKSAYKNKILPSMKRGEELKSIQKDLKQMDIEEFAGTYTWNAGQQEWDVDHNNPPDKVVIVFPADGPQSQDNNATLTLHEFEEQTFEDEWGEWQQPTSVHLDLFVDGNKEMEFIMSATYDNEGEPLSAELDVLLGKFDFSASFSDTGSQMSIQASIEHDDTSIMSVNLAIDYTTEIDEWGWEQKVPTYVEGYVQYGPFRLEGSMNIEELEKLDDPVADDINQHVNLVLLSHPDGRKVADVVAVDEEGKDEPVAYLLFPDDSKEPVEKYVEPMIEEFEKWIEDLIGEPVG